jgi:GPH family glycoside/pentoside/hexuronide:cation symporter
MTTQTRMAPKLSFATKTGYGFGMLATTVSGTSLTTGVITVFLNQVIGLPVAMVGLAVMLSLIFDAVVDPLIGIWSDATRTRWGRRHPFIYAAAIPCGLAVFLLWQMPEGLSQTTTFALVVASLVLVRFFAGMNDTASAALAPEMAPDYHQRTGLMAYRYFFNIAGSAAMTMLLYMVFLRRDAAHPLGILNRAGYTHYGVVAGIMITLAIFSTALSTHHLIPQLLAPEKRDSLKDSIKEVVGTLTNRSLLVMMACGLVGGTGNGITYTMQNYFYLYFWDLSPQTRGLLVLAGVPAALIGGMAAQPLARRMGKKFGMITLFMLTVVTGLIPMTCRLLGFFPPNGSPWVFAILFADTFVVAILAMMGYVLLTSMVADVVEDAAVKTGRRSEGLLFSANNLVPKLSIAVGGFLATLMLSAIKFPVHAQQGSVDPAMMTHLATIYLPVSAGFGVISILILLAYGIDQKKHEANLVDLAERGLVGLPEGDVAAVLTGGPLAPSTEVDIAAE